MEVFITDKPKTEEEKEEKEEATVSQRDTEGAHMLAFCELCWDYDYLANLTIFHPNGNRGNHEPAHDACVLKLGATSNYEICTC